MKFFKSRNGAITFLLVALLVVSFFWIVKSEIRASILISKLEEHHNSLGQNADILKGLTKFYRSAGKNKLDFTKGEITLSSGNTKMTINPKGIDFGIADFLLQMDKDLKTFGLSASTTFGIHLDLVNHSLFLENKNSTIDLKENNIDIKTKGDIKIGPPGRTLGYSKKLDNMYMQYDDSKIYLGQFGDSTGKSIGKRGILVEGKKNGPHLAVWEDRITLVVPSKDGDYKLFIDPVNQLVGMKKGHSEITIKKDNINIEALGDINITSKNGKVNINGKR
jgi:hypothetical protein